MRDNGLTVQSAAPGKPRGKAAMLWLAVVCAMGLLTALSAWLVRTGPGPLLAGPAASPLTLIQTAVLRDLPGPVRALACSPDGRRLAVGTDRGVSIYHAGTPDLSAQLEPRAPVQCLAFAPDGWILAAGTSDGTVYQWEGSTGIRVRSFEGSAEPVLSLAFSPDGRTLAAGSSDGTVRLWSEGDGQLRLTLQHGEGVTGLGFSSDGATLISASAGAMRRWRVADGQALGRQGGGGPVAFSADGALVACASGDWVRLWRTSDGQPVLTIVAHGVQALALAGRGIVAAVADDDLRLWRIDDGRPLVTAPWVAGTARGLAFSSNGRMLAGATDDAAWAWSVAGEQLPLLVPPTPELPTRRPQPTGTTRPTSTARPTRTPRPTATAQPTRTPEPTATASPPPTPWPTLPPVPPGPRGIPITAENAAHLQQVARWGKGAIKQIAYSSDGRRLAVASRLGVYLHDTATYSETQVLEDGNSVSLIAFSPDGQLLAAVVGEAIHVWRLADARLLYALEGHTDEIRLVAFSPDGSILASGSRDSTVRLWRATDGQPLRILEHNHMVFCLAFSPDGTLLATSSDAVRLWRVADGQVVRSMGEPGDWGADIAFSPDGAMVAAIADNSLRLWRAADGTLVRKMFEQYFTLQCFAFAPAGDLVAGGCAWGELVVGRVSDGQALYSLKWGDSVETVAFSPDGSELAVGSLDGTVSVLRAGDGQLLRRLEGWYSYYPNDLVFSPDGSLVATTSSVVSFGTCEGSCSGRVTLWRAADGRRAYVVETTGRSASNVTFSPDGGYVAAVDEHVDASLWRARDGAPYRTVSADVPSIYDIWTMALSPNMCILATSHYEGQTVVLQDMKSGERISSLAVDANVGLAFSPDSSSLATLGLDSVLRLWRLPGASAMVEPGPPTWEWAGMGPANIGQPITVGNAVRLAEAARWGRGRLNTLAYAPDGQILAVGSSLGICLFDARSLRELRLLVTDSTAYGLAFSPDGKLLAAVTDSGVQLWPLVNGERVYTVAEGCYGPIAFSPDGTALVVADRDVIRVYRVPGESASAIPFTTPAPAIARTRAIEPGNAGLLTEAARWDGTPIETIVYSPDGRFLAVAIQAALILYDGSTLEPMCTLARPGYQRLAFDRSGRLLAAKTGSEPVIWNGTLLAGKAGGEAAVWEVSSGQLLRSLGSPSDPTTNYALSPAGDMLAGAGADGAVKLWRTGGGQPLYSLAGPNGRRAPGIAFSADGALLAVGRADGTIELWDAAGGSHKNTLGTGSGETSEVLFSPDGSLLASWTHEGDLHLWRVADGKLRNTFAGSGGESCAAFSPDGVLLAWDDGKSVHITVASDGQAVCSVEGDLGAFSPDGAVLATMGEHGGIYVYGTADGKLLATLPTPWGHVDGLAFSPDGRALLSWERYEGMARVWAVGPDT